MARAWLVQAVTNALKLLRVQVVDAKEGQPLAVAERPTPCAPKTNGAIERMIGLVKGEVRAMQMTLEKLAKAHIPQTSDHVVVGTTCGLCAAHTCHGPPTARLRTRGCEEYRAHRG